MKSRSARWPPAAQTDSVPVLLQNQQRAVPVNCVRMERTASAILAFARTGEAELSLVLVSDRRMRALNRRYRKKDRPTDVLAFPMQKSPLTLALSLQGRGKEKISSPGAPIDLPNAMGHGERIKVRGHFLGNLQPHQPPVLIGDVVISVPTAKRQAAERGHGLYEEMSRLLVHGVLHLLGYDHERGPREAARMARKERTILRAIRSS